MLGLAFAMLCERPRVGCPADPLTTHYWVVPGRQSYHAMDMGMRT